MNLWAVFALACGAMTHAATPSSGVVNETSTMALWQGSLLPSTAAAGCTGPADPGRSLDLAGDGAIPHLDIRRLALGEPFLGDLAACATPAPKNLLFNLKVESAAATTSGNAWVILWNRQNPVPDETGTQQVALGGFFIGKAGFGGTAPAQLESQGVPTALSPSSTATVRQAANIHVGGKAADLVRTLDVMGNGDLLVGGHFQAALRLAPGASGVVIGAGGTDVFVQSLDAQTQVRWARSFGGVGDDELATATELENGGALLLLRHEQPLPLEIAGQKRVFTPANGQDALLVWLDETGTVERAVPIRSSGNDDLHLSRSSPMGRSCWPANSSGRRPGPWARARVGRSAAKARPMRSCCGWTRRASSPISHTRLQRVRQCRRADRARKLHLARRRLARRARDRRERTSADDRHQRGARALRPGLSFGGAPGEKGEGVQKITALAATNTAVTVLGIFEDEMHVNGIDREIRSQGKSDIFVARVQ